MRRSLTILLSLAIFVVCLLPLYAPAADKISGFPEVAANVGDVLVKFISGTEAQVAEPGRVLVTTAGGRTASFHQPAGYRVVAVSRHGRHLFHPYASTSVVYRSETCDTYAVKVREYSDCNCALREAIVTDCALSASVDDDDDDDCDSDD